MCMREKWQELGVGSTGLWPEIHVVCHQFKTSGTAEANSTQERRQRSLRSCQADLGFSHSWRGSRRTRVGGKNTGGRG